MMSSPGRRHSATTTAPEAAKSAARSSCPPQAGHGAQRLPPRPLAVHSAASNRSAAPSQANASTPPPDPRKTTATLSKPYAPALARRYAQRHQHRKEGHVLVYQAKLPEEWRPEHEQRDNG